MSCPRLLQFLAIAFACLFVSAAMAAGAGKITYLEGHADILAADGKTRAAQKSALISQGDTVLTGKDGKLDIRFSDDSIFQLRPESQFRIEEYLYNGKADGQEKASYRLLKGAFRTVTGVIGKNNKQAYMVATSEAAIGIRGTDYTARLANGLRVSVNRGEIFLSNRAGSFAVTEGQSAYVRDADSAPVYQRASDADRTGGSASAGSGGTQIRGNTRVEASTNKTTATASGRANKAGNQAGVIGGD